MELPTCKYCGRVLLRNEKEVCRDCKKEEELFCIKCKVNLRHGISKLCFDCLQEREYNRQKKQRYENQK